MSQTHAPWWLALAVSGLSMLGTIYTQYSHDSSVVIQRISILETHQDDTSRRLDRIESKLDRVVEWALGDTTKK